MKKICGNCKHWYNLWEDDSCGSCNILTEEDRYRSCCLYDTGKYNKCRVYDDSDPITTEKNFGCIHWRKK